MIARRSLFAALLCIVGHSAGAADFKPAPMLIELFTALGCSSCPPADEILTRLAQRPDVVALAFHVDYWDNSWTDHFAIPASKTRQGRYRLAFHHDQVFTPEMVIDGALDLPGNDGRAVADAFLRATAGKPPGPGIALQREGETSLSVTVGASSDTAKADVWLAVFDGAHTEEVKRGENRGRTIVNVNIVRQLRNLGRYNGQPWTASIPLDPPVNAQQGLAVFVQPPSMGRIIASAMSPPDGQPSGK